MYVHAYLFMQNAHEAHFYTHHFDNQYIHMSLPTSKAKYT